MKIVCDNCATKYSIADEKVRGKVFKIRCKKCSHIIVVRGNEGAAAAAPDAGGDGFPGDEPPTTVAPSGAQGAAAGSDSVWHLVVDREQIGPLTAAEVRQKFAAGEIDVETYAWREGFADWLRLGSIDDFRDLGGAQAEPEGATRRTDSADLFSNANSGDDSGGNDAGADLFGSAAAQAASAPAPAAADAFGGGGGLFGAPEQAAPAPRAARTSSPGFTPSAQPAMAMGGGEAVDGGGKMTGQRNENSVLFSLNNLQALASGGGGGGAAAAKAGVDNRPGFANSQTEGSGLIDIRAMAASTLAASPASSARGGSDEPEIAAAPIFSPMAAPILMPAAPSGPPKWIWAVLGVGVLAVIGIVIVGVLLLTKKTEPTVVAGGPGTVPAGTVAAPGTAAAPGTTAAPATAPAATPDKAAATPDKAAAEAKGTAPDKTEDKGPKKSSGKHEPKAAAAPRPEKSHESASPAPEAAPTPAPAKKGGKRDELDDLLNGASPDKPAAKPKAAAHEDSSGGGDDSLPEQLEKGQIVGGMSKVKGKVAGCYDQFKVPGMASVNVTIQKSGAVSSATVGGAFAGTPTGSCVEKAVKSASFPKFKGSPMSLTYPFMLR